MVFMGDVGALAIGGALGAVAVFSKQELRRRTVRETGLQRGMQLDCGALRWTAWRQEAAAKAPVEEQSSLDNVVQPDHVRL